MQEMKSTSKEKKKRERKEMEGLIYVSDGII